MESLVLDQRPYFLHAAAPHYPSLLVGELAIVGPGRVYRANPTMCRLTVDVTATLEV